MDFSEKLTRNLRIAAVGGLLVLAPLVLLSQALNNMSKTINSLLGPLMKRIPGAEISILGITPHKVIAFLILVLLCWAFGKLTFRTRLGRAFGSWIVNNVLRRTPLFTTYEKVLGEQKPEKHLEAALVRVAGDWRPGAVVATKGDWATTVIPNVPRLDESMVACVPESHVRRLGIPMDTFLTQLRAQGYGVTAWLDALGESS